MTDLTCTARVTTDRPARYGKQLASHLGRRADATWDEQGDRGRIEFDAGVAQADLTCGEGVLEMSLTTPADLAERFEGVLGRHLARFGARDELVVQWQRSDGSEGTRQTADE